MKKADPRSAEDRSEGAGGIHLRARYVPEARSNLNLDSPAQYIYRKELAHHSRGPHYAWNYIRMFATVKKGRRDAALGTSGYFCPGHFSSANARPMMVLMQYASRAASLESAGLSCGPSFGRRSRSEASSRYKELYIGFPSPSSSLRTIASGLRA